MLGRIGAARRVRVLEAGHTEGGSAAAGPAARVCTSRARGLCMHMRTVYTRMRAFVS